MSLLCVAGEILCVNPLISGAPVVASYDGYTPCQCFF